MIPVGSFKGKHVALFGLGGSGLETLAALRAGGASVVGWDDNPDRVESAAAKGLPVSDLRSADWSGFDALVLAPGVPLTHPEPHWTVNYARAEGVEIIGDIELFCRERRRVAPEAKLVAITGTNGKSTTTALVSHILRGAGHDVQMGGNIGTPALALAPLQSSRRYVIECSSYQIDLSPTLDPDVGVHLNLSPDHLDRHGDMDHYAAVKESLPARSRFAVIGVDDDHSAAIADRCEQAGVQVARISTRRAVSSGVYVSGSTLTQADNGAQRKIVDLVGVDALRGAHNAENAAAAAAVCLRLGVEPAQIVSGLQSFPGLAHRMEIVARRGKVLFVNDSKATNTDAAARALASFERIYWIAGGRAKEGGIASLEGFFPKIAKAYLIGEAADDFSRSLLEHTPFVMAETLAEAVKAAARDAAEDGFSEPVVLLSPACASFDQFANFEQRGAAFVDAVKQLGESTFATEGIAW